MSANSVRGPIRKTEPRRGIIGHEALSFAESFSWADKLPNATDFEFLLVDLRPGTFSHLRLRPRQVELLALREMIYRQVYSGGTCVLLVEDIDAEIPVLAPQGQPQTVPIRLLIPLEGGFSKENGRSIVTLTDTANDYLRHLTEWHFRFTISGAFPYLNNPSGNRWASNGRHILVDREGWALASDVDIGHGRLLLLPHVPSFATLEAGVAVAFESITGIAVSPQLPNWAYSVELVGVEQLQADIATRRRSIRQMESQIGSLEADLERQRRVLGLVCLDGKALEEIVRESLVELGGTIKAPYSEDEYVLELSGTECVIEVKGSTKSANMEMLGQTAKHKATAEDRAEKAVGALLVVNAFRGFAPGERGKPTRAQIPHNVGARAAEWGIPIVTGTQLLGCINAKRAGRMTGLDALQVIISSRGPVDLTEFGIDG